MPDLPQRQDSGVFHALAPTKEGLALHDAGRRMFLTQDPAEMVRILADAVAGYTRAQAVSVFLYDPASDFYGGGDPGLLPEAAVIRFVFEQEFLPTIPHTGGRFITVLPLRVPQQRVGLLVLDVTEVAEDVARMNLAPLALLANQAAMALHNAQAVSRTIGESTLLSNILDSITNAIVTLDKRHQVTLINRNAMAMLGITPDAVGRPYPEVLPPEVADAVASLLAETENLGYSLEKLVTAKLPQGLELNIAVSTSILQDDTFTPLGVIVVFRDMTASRELDRLRTLDRMKSEFVANVSHELKTPLTSIKAYTEALMDMAPDGPMKSFLKVIEEESDRLVYLINDLLNVSRIQAGKMKLLLEPVAPASVVQEVLAISTVQSGRHSIHLDLPGDLPTLLLDKEKMKEVMINLLSNAVKYSPRGGAIRVRMRVEEGNLRVEVQDEGIGIPAEHLDKVFEAFHRVDSSATAEIPGTGLGLVIAKAIVEHHGGRIWLESRPDHGTTVSILIPIRSEVRSGEPGYDLGSMA